MTEMEKAHLITTDFGPILVSDFLLNLWERYGWPSDETLKDMADLYRVYGLMDGAHPDEGAL